MVLSMLMYAINYQWDGSLMEQYDLYNDALKYLVENAGSGLREEAIKKYLVPRAKPLHINLIYKSLLKSAQNVRSSPNVIGKAISGEEGKIEPLGNILYGFSPEDIVNYYGHLTPDALFEIIKPTLHTAPNKQVLWLRYCKTILSGASFLSQFKDHLEFYKFADHYYNNERRKLPKMISDEVCGIGFALACDFLKELGYVKYGKPDTHIKDIFIKLGILKGVSKESSEADYLSLKIIDEIASRNGVTPYAVDKALWLICSGNYYLDKLEIKGQKEEFISYMKKG